MSKPVHADIAAVLIYIEAQLRQLNLWDKIPPSTQALASVQPFCVDTLTFPQWLQFVFIPTLYQMMEAGEPLPEACSIAPMADAYFRHTGAVLEPLLASLGLIDDLLCADRAGQP
jgi:uncharacterized protein YqcC (DUF446 family)